MGCSNSSKTREFDFLCAKLDAIEAKLAAISSPALGGSSGSSREPSREDSVRTVRSLALKQVTPSLSSADSRVKKRSLRQDGYDVFVSHAKKLLQSEERAVWVADVVEAHGLRPFFDKTDLNEVTEIALKDALLLSDVVVTILDPFTFKSRWVLKENLFAANMGIPIVVIYDADRFRWEGQLDKWQRLYPFLFSRQVIPLSKSQRRASVDSMIAAVSAAAAEVRKPLAEDFEASISKYISEAKVGTGGSRETATSAAVDSAYEGMLKRLHGNIPSLIVAAFTCTHRALDVAKCIHKLAPSVPMIGCTSCRGIVLNDTWLSHKKEFALGMWGICDDAGSYTTLHLETRPSNLRETVMKEVERMIEREDIPPSFAVLLGSPGDEEIILDGMQTALGFGVPILGGSSADNTVAGDWKQIAKAGTSHFVVGEPSVSGSGITIARHRVGELPNRYNSYFRLPINRKARNSNQSG